MKLVITGGHHSSALPVIRKLKESHPDIEIYWFGHKHSLKGSTSATLEYEEITALGVPFYDLKAGKLYRTYDIKRLLKVPLGVIHAKILLFKLKPDLILSFGGYLAAPTVIAGWMLGIPSITHEQTVVAGHSNRLISRFAKKILVSWPQSQKYYPADKVVLTGIPLRHEIFESAGDIFQLNSTLPTVYITGGKTGSHVLNLTVGTALNELLQKYNVIHQTGSHSQLNDRQMLEEKYASLEPRPQGAYIVKEFVYGNEVGEAYTKANVVVARSGAHTTAEILALEKPAVLIPIPWVSHNEQMENAKMVESAGLGVIVEEKDLRSESLLDAIGKMVSAPENFKLKDRSFKEAVSLDTAAVIVNEILKYHN